MSRTLFSFVLVAAASAAGCASPASSDNPFTGLGPKLHFDAGTCPVGTTQCGNKCSDLKSDNLDCGTCGNACPADFLCQAGHCTMGMVGACTGSQVRCNGQCTDTSMDDANCGMCANGCNQDQTCQKGVCAAAMCPQGQKSCGGQCTDITTDMANCGACGNACPNGQACAGGACAGATGGCKSLVACLNKCMDVACQNQCLGQSTVNARMLLDAALMCLDTACPSTNGGVCDSTAMAFNQMACNTCSSKAQMGMCSPQVQACLQDMGAMGGCPMGQTSCNGKCTTLATDTANCGACGVACAQGQTCMAGKCAGGGCPQGQKLCNNKCTDTTTDAANCGACAKVCMQGQSCMASMCVNNGCPMGQVSCGGVCTNTRTDVANCGACGKACAQGQTCMAGVCGGGMGGMTGCAGAVSCLNNCNTQACSKACINNTTQNGLTLLSALFNCLDTACPGTGGGVCDAMAMGYSAKACDACYATAQGVGGTCRKKLNTCLANGP